MVEEFDMVRDGETDKGKVGKVWPEEGIQARAEAVLVVDVLQVLDVQAGRVLERV